MKNIVSLDPNSISTIELHQILLTAVAPRPIALASTISADGKVNLSPFSFFNVFSANPPILIFSPARRVRDNTVKHTLENVKITKEVVINVVNFPIVEQMSLSSTEYDRETNEFKKAGLTEVPSEKVRSPRVSESPVSFECVVDDVIELGKQGGAGNLVICKVIFIHINRAYLDEKGKLDTLKLQSVARLGGSWYSKVTNESLFEIPKPVSSNGIGVDQLPLHIFKTDILSGNNLGRLGNAERIPSEKELSNHRKSAEIHIIIEIKDAQERIEMLHTLVREYLNKDNFKLAINTLFAI
ncbi:flavin reductase family protein [Hyunsoonleella sp. 2307UL5-6]|uniref:flavin reductase family protein n=1 Tax=Hyunsoonleella sp. 2307UL5-6 TaxID=3384768 RepID=UPI0039BC68A9